MLGYGVLSFDIVCSSKLTVFENYLYLRTNIQQNSVPNGGYCLFIPCSTNNGKCTPDFGGCVYIYFYSILSIIIFGAFLTKKIIPLMLV